MLAMQAACHASSMPVCLNHAGISPCSGSALADRHPTIRQQHRDQTSGQNKISLVGRNVLVVGCGHTIGQRSMLMQLDPDFQ